MSDIWTGTELDEYVIEGYNALAMATGCFWATDVAPDLPFAFNYTQKFEFEYFVGGDLVSGLAQFTSEFERDWVDNSDGPANHTYHWEFNDGHVDEEGLTTEISALVDLPLDLYEIERAVWQTRRIDAQRTRHFEMDDHRYELSKGPVDAYMQDKDGLRRLRKWRVPSVPYDPYEIDRIYGNAVLDSSPIGYWPLGEVSGTVMADSSENGLDGTYVNSPTLGVQGAIAGDSGTAVQFDGVDDYASVPYNAVFDTGQNFSIELWVKLTTTNIGVILERGNFSYQFYAVSGFFVFGKKLGGAMVQTTVSLDTWHHFVGTKAGSDVHLYKNGIDQGIGSDETIAYSPEAIVIGGRPTGVVTNGSIAHVAIYDRALPPAEILHHFENYRSPEYGILVDVSDIDDDTPIGEWGDFVQVGGQHMMGDPWGVICAIYKETSNMRYEYRRRGTGDCDDLELPERYQVYVRHYAQARANEREGDGQDLDLAEHYMGRFREGVARMLKRRQAMHYQQKYILGGGRTEKSRPVWRLPYSYGRRVR